MDMDSELLLKALHKPADLLFQNWSINGERVCLDISIIGGFVDQVDLLESKRLGKNSASCLKRGFFYLPFVIETSGRFGPGAMKAMGHLTCGDEIRLKALRE